MKQELSPSIRELLEYARLAPSVHNSQPWRFIVKGTTITIAVSTDRVLGSGDPTSRESWISFGICLETLLQAAKGLGLKAEITDIQGAALNDHIATVQITEGSFEKRPAVLQALKDRHTYREKMVPVEIPEKLKTDCQTAVEDLEGVGVFFMEDKAAINEVAQFTFKAMSIALSSPDFRRELYHFVHYNWSPARVGMHGYTLGEGLLGSIFSKLSIKLGLGLSLKAKHDKQRIQDASALVFVGTSGDVPSFWLRAGRAYLRIALELAKSGLAQGTLAAPIEAPGFHEDIEKMLGTGLRLQTMLRVGKATHAVRSSPRLNVDELTSP
jgi:hypothetical protein